MLQKPMIIPNQKSQIIMNLPKNVQDDIEKDVTAVTGSKEFMGGSEHSQNEFPYGNIDIIMQMINSNKDQKQRLVQKTQMDQSQKVQKVAI